MPGAATPKYRIKQLDSTFRWGSHRPVLEALLEVYRPRIVLELGVGESSTPLLHGRAPTLVSVENNGAWLKRVTAGLRARPGFHPRHHPLYTDRARTEELHFSTLPRDAGPAVLAAAEAQYRALLGEFGRFDLVLVDQYAATRRTSLEVLALHADILVIHDTEVCGLEPAAAPFDCYEYNPFFESPQAAAFWHLRFDAMMPWTDVLIRGSLSVDAPDLARRFDACLAAYAARFPGEGRDVRGRGGYLLRAPAASIIAIERTGPYP